MSSQPLSFRLSLSGSSTRPTGKDHIADLCNSNYHLGAGQGWRDGTVPRPCVIQLIMQHYALNWTLPRPPHLPPWWAQLRTKEIRLQATHWRLGRNTYHDVLDSTFRDIVKDIEHLRLYYDEKLLSYQNVRSCHSNVKMKPFFLLIQQKVLA